VTSRKLPFHGRCFVCGPDNSLGIQFQEVDGRIFATARFNDEHQGPPKYTHGGSSAAVLDEAMGTAVWNAGMQVVAVHLAVDYRKPIPLGELVTVHAWIKERDERRVHTVGEIRLAGDIIAVSARGIFVEAPQFFTNADNFQVGRMNERMKDESGKPKVGDA